MLSGGLLSGGDWCVGDYCTSWSIIGEAVTDVAEEAYDHVIEPVGSGIATAAVSTYDFFDTVSSNEFWNYYTSEPSRAWSAMTAWYGDSAHPEKKLLAFLPFLPLGLFYGVPALATAATGTSIFGGLLLGGSAVGCSWYSSTSTNAEYSTSSNMRCTDTETNIFRYWQDTCRSNGGHVRIISNVSGGGDCDIEAVCDF